MSSSSSAATISKQDLRRLIAEAASGEREKIERLISPFLIPEERLLWCGITAKIGLIPTYDFGFVTNRRIGDLQITPLTGNLNVEVCDLARIDAYVLVQPAIPIWMWLVMGVVYPLAALAAWMMFGYFFRTLFRLQLGFVYFYFPWTLVRLSAVSGALVVTFFAVVPWLKRLYLRLRKSGLWLKLRGSWKGTLIFADRDKFAALTAMSRVVTEQKRLLDMEGR
jgi:hypothetical protein